MSHASRIPNAVFSSPRFPPQIDLQMNRVDCGLIALIVRISGRVLTGLEPTYYPHTCCGPFTSRLHFLCSFARKVHSVYLRKAVVLVFTGQSEVGPSVTKQILFLPLLASVQRESKQLRSRGDRQKACLFSLKVLNCTEIPLLI